MFFGTDNLIRLDLALVLQWGDSVSEPPDRAGQGQLAAPRRGGSGACGSTSTPSAMFDPSAGVVALDAVLVDSKLVRPLRAHGLGGVPAYAGLGGFALAVGGFHPRFRPPDGFPALPRITVALTHGDNPKLICEAYLAITANTVQIGASATLYASACGFSIEGNVGFDVLIELVRFRTTSPSSGPSVQLKRGSPQPVQGLGLRARSKAACRSRVRGRATFEILLVGLLGRLRQDSSRWLVRPSAAGSTPCWRLLQQLRRARALASPSSPARCASMVSCGPRTSPEGRILLHPMGPGHRAAGRGPPEPDPRHRPDRRRHAHRATAGSPSRGSRVGSDEQVTASGARLLRSGPVLRPHRRREARGAVVRGDGRRGGLRRRDYTFVDGRRQSRRSTTPTSRSAPTARRPRRKSITTPTALVIRMLALRRRRPGPDPARRLRRFAAAPREDVPVLRPRGWAVAEAGSTEPATVAATWAEAKSLAGLATTAGPRVLVPTALIEEG